MFHYKLLCRSFLIFSNDQSWSQLEEYIQKYYVLLHDKLEL